MKLAFASALIFLLPLARADDETPGNEPQPLMEIAICLDTSGSMDGLINAARQKLWAIVNDLATSKPTPRFRLALLTFGNNGHTAESGWVQVETDFTEDLDLVSQKLFALTTNGGEEYVGRVMQAALQQLSWSGTDRDLKLLFVCGNEGADQDPAVDAHAMCRDSISRGIMVNSIYCGSPTDDAAPGWKQVATLADGHFATIDQDNGTTVVTTPFDEAMVALSSRLNDTYIPMGESGSAGRANQMAQDRNALGLNEEAAASRAWTKCQTAYVCGWDLVDGVTNGKVDLATVKPEQLPEALRGLSQEELAARVEAQRQAREQVKTEMADLNEKREKFIRDEAVRQGRDRLDAFDRAVRTAVRAQASQLGFEFAEPLPQAPNAPQAPAAPAAPQAPAAPAAPQAPNAPAAPQAPNAPQAPQQGSIQQKIRVQQRAAPAPAQQMGPQVEEQKPLKIRLGDGC